MKFVSVTVKTNRFDANFHRSFSQRRSNGRRSVPIASLLHSIFYAFRHGAGRSKRYAGDIVNDLTASVGDPNSQIPETKVFLCNIKKKERA